MTKTVIKGSWANWELQAKQQSLNIPSWRSTIYHCDEHRFLTFQSNINIEIPNSVGKRHRDSHEDHKRDIPLVLASSVNTKHTSARFCSLFYSSRKDACWQLKKSELSRRRGIARSSEGRRQKWHLHGTPDLPTVLSHKRRPFLDP